MVLIIVPRIHILTGVTDVVGDSIEEVNVKNGIAGLTIGVINVGCGATELKIVQIKGLIQLQIFQNEGIKTPHDQITTGNQIADIQKQKGTDRIP